MKKNLLIIISFLLVGYVKAQTEPVPSSIQFEKTEHDFGSQAQGTPVTYEFKFTNIGNTPLELENVKPGCGCTTPDWTRGLIAPGESGIVSAQYNMQSPGSFKKSVTVTTKGGESIVLYISGNAVVQMDKTEESQPADPNK